MANWAQHAHIQRFSADLTRYVGEFLGTYVIGMERDQLSNSVKLLNGIPMWTSSPTIWHSIGMGERELWSAPIEPDTEAVRRAARDTSVLAVSTDIRTLQRALKVRFQSPYRPPRQSGMARIRSKRSRRSVLRVDVGYRLDPWSRFSWPKESKKCCFGKSTVPGGTLMCE